MWEVHDEMGWWMVVGMTWMVIFWGGFIWAVVWGISRLSARDHPTHEPPLGVAKRRYASGEIAKEQFEQLRRDLS